MDLEVQENNMSMFKDCDKKCTIKDCTCLPEEMKNVEVIFEEVTSQSEEGLRYNKGKLRYDLINPIAQRGLVAVLTKGASKYAERNWEKGMKWSKVLASMKRHIAAFELGKDYDIDPSCQECQKSTKENWQCQDHTGELHADCIQCNAHFLSAYYKIYPQGDDRKKTPLGDVKIALDIDEILCDWVGGWCEKYGYSTPEAWSFSYDTASKFKELEDSGELEEFYLSLQPKISPSDLPFEPHCYITSRSVPVEITKKWLQQNGFPTKPVHSVGFGESKVGIAKQEKIDIFVDDSYSNYKELNENGICCFLWDAPHNQRYNVGFKRIKNLNELM